jgi:cell division protein FtsB
VNLKITIQSCIVLAFSFWFLHHLIMDKGGILEYSALEKNVKIEEKKLEFIESEITELQKTISQLQSNDFTKEKIAREDLLMSHPDELVYVTPF